MKYVFSMLPETAEIAEFNFDPFTREQEEWAVFRVRVVRHNGEDDWTIRRHLRYLIRNRYPEVIEWSNPVSDDNIFSLEEALAIAEEIIWRLSVNGKSAQQIIRERYPHLEHRLP